MPIAAGISAAGAVASGAIGAFGAKKAADTQAQSAANALNYQRQVFDYQKGQYDKVTGESRANFSPYMDIGKGATYSLASLYGLPGGSGNGTADYSQFYKTPDYNFAFEQGEKATQNVLSAQGNLLSGSGLTALTNFGQGLASQQYGNYFNRLMGLANLGQTATNNYTGQSVGALNSLNQAGTASGQQVGNSMQAIGQANASGYVGMANSIGGAVQGAGNSLSLPYYASALKGMQGNNNPSSYATGNAGYLPGGSMPSGGYAFNGMNASGQPNWS